MSSFGSFPFVSPPVLYSPPIIEHVSSHSQSFGKIWPASVRGLWQLASDGGTATKMGFK